MGNKDNESDLAPIAFGENELRYLTLEHLIEINKKGLSFFLPALLRFALMGRAIEAIVRISGHLPGSPFKLQGAF